MIEKEILDPSIKVFKDLAKNIFEDNHNLESFGWNQYTPYFDNDGENCNFSANTDHIYINGKSAENNPDLLKITYEVKEFLSKFNEYFFISQFGDHAEITVTSKGVSVDECEHD
jgi:hypothetical protein